MYTVISQQVYPDTYNSDVAAFTLKITEALRSGWQVQGGVSVTWNDTCYLFVQALCRAPWTASAQGGLDIVDVANQVADIIRQRSSKAIG